MESKTLDQCKNEAAIKQGFESWESFEKWAKLTDVCKAYPSKFTAMCDVYTEIYAAQFRTQMEEMEKIIKADRQALNLARHEVPKTIGEPRHFNRTWQLIEMALEKSKHLNL